MTAGRALKWSLKSGRNQSDEPPIPSDACRAGNVILWDNELNTASVYTHDQRLINKLKALSEKYPDQYRLERRGPQRAVTYTVPKKSIGIRPPYGESRRQRDIENARKNGLPFMKPLQEEQDVER